MKFKKLIELIKNQKLKIYFLENHIQKLQEDIDYYVNKDIVQTKQIEKLNNNLLKKEEQFLYAKYKQYVIKKDIVSLVYWVTDGTDYNIIICFYNREPIELEFKDKKSMLEEYKNIISQL